MATDWLATLTEQLTFHWEAQLRPRLDGLSDGEYRWEPVPGAWNLRPRAEATTPMAAGAGEVVADFAFPEPDPAPVTTIAWRMGHLSVGVLGMRAANHFGDGGVDYATTNWPLSAEGGLAMLDESYDAWMTGLAGLSQADLERPCGPAEGPWSEAPFATLILHINREVIHHGAEVSLLRDRFRAEH